MSVSNEINGDREHKARELASEIMVLARNQVLVNLRFMDRAIANIKIIPNNDATFCTDGRGVYYSPWFLLNMYQNEPSVVTRDLLHSILHCVFRHNFVGKDIKRNAWDLACDIAVENAINELSQPAFFCRRTEYQSAVVGRLKEALPALSAERIYHRLISEDFSDAVIEKERIPFVGDDHAPWYNAKYGSEGVQADIDLEELWKSISKRMETELEAVMGRDDALTQNLKDINRARYNYTEFLRRFGIHGEVMKLSDEEFDNNYYTYGMELYGNIPLIEPLEYRDLNKIRDFVIAIDTSGSVEGEVVQKFVQHTHDILARQENFYTKVNMYIIQCDDCIQDAAYISDKDDFDKYLKEMKIKGLGETDFRPVFAYVDDLVAKGKLTDLRGVLYFTDGKGTFPAEKPDYDVAFIIHDDGFSNVWTPDWAMKLYLAEEDILDERFGS